MGSSKVIFFIVLVLTLNPFTSISLLDRTKTGFNQAHSVALEGEGAAHKSALKCASDTRLCETKISKR